MAVRKVEGSLLLFRRQSTPIQILTSLVWAEVAERDGMQQAVPARVGPPGRCGRVASGQHSQDRLGKFREERGAQPVLQRTQRFICIQQDDPLIAMIRKMVGDGSFRWNIQSQAQGMQKWFRRGFHMAHIERGSMRILAFTQANELLKQSRFANAAGSKDMKDKERQMFGADCRGENVQLAFTPNKTGMARLPQMFSKAGRHVPSRMNS